MLGLVELILVTCTLQIDKDLSLAIQIGEKAIMRMNISKNSNSVAALHMLEEVINNLKILNELLEFDDTVRNISSIEKDTIEHILTQSLHGFNKEQAQFLIEMCQCKHILNSKEFQQLVFFTSLKTFLRPSDRPPLPVGGAFP